MDLVKRDPGRTAAIDAGVHPPVTIAPAVVHNLGVRTALAQVGGLQPAVETVGKIIRASPAVRGGVGPSMVEVKAEIFERQWGRVAVGQDATMTVRSLAGSVFRGKVIHVESPDDYMAHELEVALRFRTGDPRLLPGMFAQVRILGAARAGLLLVPRGTIISGAEGERVVRVLGDGRYQPVVVTLGQEADGMVEVRSGLDPGDQVVTSGQFLIDSESHLLSGLRRMATTGTAD